MGKICEVVYLDAHGNRSSAYYDNLHLGEGRALELYAASMAPHAFAKFQKGQGKIESFIETSRLVKKPGSNILDETQRRFVSPNGVPLKGVTRFLNEGKQPFVEREAATLMVVRNRAKELLYEDPKAYDAKLTKIRLRDNKYKLEDYPEVMEKAYAWAFGEGYDTTMTEKELLTLPLTDAAKKRVGKVLDLWDGKTELGTQIHAVIEEFINHYSTQEPDENGEIDRDLSVAHALNSPNVSPKLNAKQKTEYQKLLPQIEKFMLNIGRGKKLRFETEVAVFDEQLGVGGFVDLMAFDTETGDVYIFDFKTKDRGKEWLFNYKSEKRQGLTSDLWDNKETDGALQTSLYRLMMERQGFNVVSSSIAYIEGDIQENTDGDFYYENLSYAKNIRLRYHRSALSRLFAAQGTPLDKPRKSDAEAGKLSSVNQLLDSVADQNLWERSEKSIKATVDHIMNSLNVDEKTGAKYFFNQATGRREYFKVNDTEESMRERIRTYVKDRDASLKELSNNIISYFNSGMTTWKGGGRHPEVAKQQADLLLAGLDPKHYTLEQLNNFEGFPENEVSSDILIAIDQRDRSAIIINLNRKDPSAISIKHQVETDQKKKRKTANEKSVNMFQRKFSDDTLRRKYGIEGLTSTDQDFKLLRGGVLALELMDKGIVSRVDLIRNGAVTGTQAYNGDFTPPKNVGMQTMLKHLKVLKDFAGDDASTYYKELLSNPKYTDQEPARRNFVNALYDLIDSGMSEMKKKTSDELVQQIKEWNSTHGTSNKGLLKSLLAAQTELGKAKASNESRATSEDYVLISQAILQLAEINLSAGAFSEKLSAENKVRVTSTIANEAISQLDFQVKKTKNHVNRLFQDYKRKHKKVYDALAAEAKAHNLDVREYMKQLYIVDPSTRTAEVDKANVDVLFTLRPVDDKNLSDAQRNYIKFFNETVKDGFKMAVSDSRHKQIDNGTEWKTGMIPIMSKRDHTRLAETESVKDKIRESIRLGWKRNVKNDKESFAAINTRIDYPYIGQLGTGIQNGYDRLGKLGVDLEGNRYEGFEYDQLETNLEAILNTFYADSLRTAEYTGVLGIYNAMNTIGFIEEKFKMGGESDTERFNVRHYMDEYIKLIVFNEVHKEKSQMIDKVGQVMTLTSLGFSPKQMLLEGVTNIFAATNSVLQQSMMGKDKRYNPTDWVKAGQLVTGRLGSKGMSLAEAITTTFGIYNADPESFHSQEFVESAKNDIFQSKWAYALNNLPFKFVKQQSFIAELNHQGILEALSLNEETNSLQYDPAKDARFKDIFHGGALVKHFDTKEKREQKALFDYLVKSLAEEDGVDENGMPLRPLATAEVVSMLDYGRAIFGSLDSDQKVLAQATSFGRMFLKFKNWAISKKDNYWTTTHQSRVRGSRKPVTDEAGEIIGYTWEAESMEGIMQTLFHLSRSTAEILRSKDRSMGNFKNLVQGMTKNQKENMTKLTADVVMVAVLITIFSALFDDDEFKHGPGKLVAQTMMNATNDLNMIGLAQSMIDNGPIASLGFINRTLGNMYEGVAAAVTGDPNKGMEKLMNMTGITKSIYAFIQ